MEQLDILFQSNPNELIHILDQYQVEIIETLLAKNSNNYLETADLWLAGTIPNNTAQFGGELNKSKVYREKLLEEFEKFVCGHDFYEEDRKKIQKATGSSVSYTTHVIISAVALKIGVVGPFIAPAIILIIVALGKIPLNAWCAMRQECKPTHT